MKIEQREHYFEMERKYIKEIDESCEQLTAINNEKEGLKQEVEKLKKGEK